MAVYMNTVEYAEYRGVTKAAVSKYIKKGQLTKSVKKIKGKYQINRDIADNELSQNLDRLYNRQATDDAVAKPVIIDKAEAIQEAGFEGFTLLEAQTEKERYAAALKKLDYETKLKHLLSADEVEKAWANRIISWRGKLLSIKGQLAPLIKEFIPNPENFGHCMESVEATIMDILQEMADAD